MIEITRILTPIDFSDHARHALSYAAALARWYGAKVTALHVLVNHPAVNVIPTLPTASIPMHSIRAQVAAHAREFVRTAAGSEAAIELAVEEAPEVASEILAQAAARRADLIVMATHGASGLERLLVGSIAERVLRKATICPVMVVPPRAAEARVPPVAFRNILCPIDFSTGSLDALVYAISLAEESDAHLTLLHAIEMPPVLFDTPTPGLDLEALRVRTEAEAMRRLQALVPDSMREFSTVETAVAEGRASQAILRVAEERHTDLIVMGVHGRGVIDLKLFGSNTNHVVRAAACPVLMVRARSPRG
jgi:nucleotide-binding universal stress UspA family protein